MHLIVSTRRLKVKSMLQVSSPGVMTPYPHDLYKKTHKLATPVSVAARRAKFSSSVVEVQTILKSPQQVSQNKRSNQRKSLSSRSSPNTTKSCYSHQRVLFQELQYSCAVAGDLFAGSKSTVTPSPSELPLPPMSWTVNLSKRCSESSVSAKDLITSGLIQDSAIIKSGPKLLA